MPIVPISDDYTYTPVAGAEFHCHTPVILSQNRLLMLTRLTDPNRGGIISFAAVSSDLVPLDGSGRIYDLATDDVANGSPFGIGYIPQTARACVATLDGRIVMQNDGGFMGSAMNCYWLMSTTGEVIQEWGDALVTYPPGNIWGDLYSRPGTMIRVPGTNRIWALRHYPMGDVVILDCLRANGDDLVREGSEIIPIGGAYTGVAAPCSIVSISDTEVITALSRSDGEIWLVHGKLDGPAPLDSEMYGGITIHHEVIDDYPVQAATDVTLYPGLAHNGEMLLQNYTDQITPKLIRIGVNWTGTAFSTEALPLTQLAIGMKPSGFTGTNYVRQVQGARYQRVDDQLYVARTATAGELQLHTLLTQYDLKTGSVVTSTWVKAAQSYPPQEWWSYQANLTLTYHPSADRIILACTEQYAPDAATAQREATRLGVYRRGYTIGDRRRSQRTAFER